MPKTLCIIVVLAATAAANAATMIDAPPDWFVVPPGPRTRVQHHSFHADPNLNQAPEDWTFDGYVPSVLDSWAMPPGVTYNQPDPIPWGFYWAPGGGGQGVPPMVGGFLDDNIGVTLPAAGTLTKTMGNIADDNETKKFYALVIGSGDVGLTITVTSPGTTVTSTSGGNGEGGTWAVFVNGTIDPQPDREDFSFAFDGPVFIDEIYIGTYCTPEPATLSLLALGGLAMIRRRRRS